MEIKDLILGIKFELGVYDSAGELIRPSFISQLEWIENENTMIIAAPIFEGKIYPIHIGAYMKVFFIFKLDLYTFRAKLKSRAVKDSMALLKIEVLSEIERIQRRQFYRFDHVMEIKYKIVYNTDIKLNDKIPYVVARTKDISGGGLCIISDVEIKRDDLIQCELKLDNDRVVTVFGKVVKSLKLEVQEINKYEIGILYKKIDNSDREAIIGYIFKEQRKLRQRGLV